MKFGSLFSTLIAMLFTSKNNAQQVQITQPEPKFPSLDLGFDLVRERLSAQSDRVNTLDTKASFILGSSTLLLGTAIVIQPTLSTCHSSIIFPTLVHKFLPIMPELLHILSLLLFIVYISGIISAYQAYKIRGLYNVPDPDAIYKSYLTKPEHETRAATFRAMIDAYATNAVEIEKKGHWTTIALRLLIAEAIILALPLLFQFVC